MADISTDGIPVQLKRLDELIEQLKAKQERIDESTLLWQRRLETKMDQQLSLTQQFTLLGTVACANPVQSRCVGPVPVLPLGGTSVTKDALRLDLQKANLGHVGSCLSGNVQQAWTGACDPEQSRIQLPGGLEGLLQPPQGSPTVITEKPTLDDSFQVSEASIISVKPLSSSEATGQEADTVSSPRSPTFPKLESAGSRNSFIKKKVLTKDKTQKLGDDYKKPKKRADQFVLAARRFEMIDSMSILTRLTTHKWYEVGVMTIIMMNSITIGLQVQVVARNIEDSYINGKVYNTEAPKGFLVSQVIFAFLFATELALRWTAEGFREFISCTEELPWNLFDIVTVFSAVVELILELVAADSMAVASISVIRVLRVARLVRLVKLIRVYPFFHELRMMVESCLNSLKLFLWLMMVLTLLTYIFGIFMTTGVCTYLADGDKNLSPTEDATSYNLQRFFGTVDKSMLSLFQTIAGGRDWYEYYDPLLFLSADKRFIYLLFISFATFAVCNVVAAVFVESAMQSSAHDRELLIREQLRDSQAYTSKMLALFEEMDDDGTGTVTMDEFLTHLDDDRVVAYFNSMQLDVSDAKNLFKLLDVDRSGSVEIHEFIEGCQKLKGESRTLDMHLMRFELQYVRNELHELTLRFYGYAEQTGVTNLSDIKVAKDWCQRDSQMPEGELVRLESKAPKAFAVEAGPEALQMREAARDGGTQSQPDPPTVIPVNTGNDLPTVNFALESPADSNSAPVES